MHPLPFLIGTAFLALLRLYCCLLPPYSTVLDRVLHTFISLIFLTLSLWYGVLATPLSPVEVATGMLMFAVTRFLISSLPRRSHSGTIAKGIWFSWCVRFSSDLSSTLAYGLCASLFAMSANRRNCVP